MRSRFHYSAAAGSGKGGKSDRTSTAAQSGRSAIIEMGFKSVMRRIPRVLVALVAIIATAVSLEATDVLTPLDRRLLDTEFRLLRLWFPTAAGRDVVVVGIDEETVRRLPEPMSLWHHHIGRFLNAMVEAKPAAVGIDIVLPDRSFEAVSPGSDKALLKGMLESRRSHPLVVAVTVDPAGKARPIHSPFIAVAGKQGWGYALFPVDGDGRVRRFDEQLGTRGERVPTLVGQMARQLGIEPGAGWIDYWRGAPFEYVPLHEVLKWLDDGDQAALARNFGGKPVLLGTVLPFTDRQPATVALLAAEPGEVHVPGVVLHAQALRTILGSGFIESVPRWITAGAIAMTALLWFVAGGLLSGALALSVAIVLFFAGAMWLATQGWFFPIAAPLLAAALAVGGRNGLATVAKLSERRRLRRSFSNYVSPAVMDEILAGRVQPEPGGTRRFVCVMFSDIRGYTTRSERMTPEQIIGFLNRYFENVVALIHERGGSVMSFMGDGIMAVFGAPNILDNPSHEAFEAARKMLQYVATLNQQLCAEGQPAIDVGIGLHAGEAVIGHVGSSTRHDYTAIGDVINVASRLEGVTKEVGHPMVISKTVAEQLGYTASFHDLGPVAIKGHSPVEAYGYEANALAREHAPEHLQPVKLQAGQK